MKLTPLRPATLTLLKRRMEEEAGPGAGLPDMSHAVLDNEGTLVGCIGLRHFPVVWWWMDPHYRRPRTSYRLLRHLEGVAEGLGYQRLLLPVHPDSPFFPYLKRMGYGSLGGGELFIKP